VLKLLQKSYHGKVKMIYIDPPYNTGNEFIYPDDYKEPLRQYLRLTGQVSEEGVKLTTNTETSGRYHSNWLSMMYPRLFLARNLLRDDGVIFVSIDDHEVHNLRLLMDEVFGDENYISDLAVIRAEGGGLAKQVVRGHDYLLIYSKKRDAFVPLKRPKDIRGKIIERDGIKYWIEEDWLRKEFGKYGTCPYDEIEKYHGPAKKKEIDEGLASGIYQLIRKDSGVTIVGRLRRVDTDGSKFYSVVKHLNASGVNDLRALGLSEAYQFPKPKSLIIDLVLGATFGSHEQGDIVLDFFAGSGTTAHAVLDLNKQDGGNRKFILVQLPEPLDPNNKDQKVGADFCDSIGKPRNIAEITKERVRRVIQKLNDEDAEKLDLNDDKKQDRGFRVFKLATSNFKIWEGEKVPQDAEGIAEQLKLYADHVLEGRSQRDILYELILKAGLPLTAKIEEKYVTGKTIYSVADGLLLICLEDEVTAELLRGMMDLKPQQIICLDRAFRGNDQLKTNTVLEMKQHKITFYTV